MQVKASKDILANMAKIAKSLNVIANKVATNSYDEAGLKAAQQSLVNASAHCAIAYKQIIASVSGAKSLVTASADTSFDEVVSAVIAVKAKCDIIKKAVDDEMPAPEEEVSEVIEAPVVDAEDVAEAPVVEEEVSEEVEAPEVVDAEDDMTDVDMDMEDDEEEEEEVPAVAPVTAPTAKTVKKASTVAASSNSNIESMWNF
jgi:hypothetical protein